MTITQEMIRALQEMVQVSYEEAERYLFRTKGDLNQAAFLIRAKQNSGSEKMKRGFKRVLSYRIIVTRKNRVLIDLPIVFGLLFFLIDRFWQRIFFIVALLILALVTECEFKIEQDQHEGEKTTTQQHKKKPSRPESQSIIIGAGPLPPDEHTETADPLKQQPYNKGEQDHYEFYID